MLVLNEEVAVSILTKVFVVLVTILSVVLVALIVPFVANTEDFKKQADAAKAAQILAEQTAALRQSEVRALKEQGVQEVISLKAERQTLLAQITTMTAKVSEAEAAVQKEQADKARSQVELSRLTASHEQFATMFAAMQKELGQRREEMVGQSTKLIELADRINQLESEKEALTRRVRQFREQVVQMEERSGQLETAFMKLPPELRAQVTGDDAATAIPYESPTVIIGRVTNVQSIADETFVQVDIGKNDGVAPNMKFLVHRGGQFLGNLVITTVDTQSSAGRIQLLQGNIASGDLVRTGGGY